MRGKNVKTINKYLTGLQGAAKLSDAKFKNVRKNVKRLVTRSPLPIMEALMGIDLTALINKSGWNND